MFLVGQVNYPKVADNSSFDEDSSDALSPEQPASHESQGSVPSPMDSRICEPLPSSTGTSLAQVRTWWPPAVPWSFPATADLWQRILKSETERSLKGIVCEVSHRLLALCGVGEVIWLFRSAIVVWGRGQPLLDDTAFVQLILADKAGRYRCEILVPFCPEKLCCFSGGTKAVG